MKFNLGGKEYLVDCDSNANITLRIKTDRKKIVNKIETDDYIYDVLGYFNTMEQVFKWFLSYLIKNKAKQSDINEIDKIVETINECNKELTNIVKDMTVYKA